MPLNQVNKSRALALVLLCMLVGLLATSLIVPLTVVYHYYDEEIADLVFRIGRYRKVLVGKDAWLERRAAMQKAEDVGEYFWSGNTAALASANLQEMLKSTLTDAGASLVSAQTLPPTEEQGHTRVGVKLSLSGNTEALKTVLYKLESWTPYLFITEMTVHSQPILFGQANAQSKQVLTIDMDVIGYMRKKP